MRKVNQITWELVKEHFNFQNIKKGETINILTTQPNNSCGFILGNDVKYFKIKAR